MQQKTNRQLMEIRTEHVPQGPFNITPIFVKRAKGALIEDVEGNEYIDFGGGIGVVNVGHCNEKVVAAIKEQADQYLHTCFHVSMYEPYIELAKQLNEITPGDFPKKTFFVNSGAEAVENSIKIARYATKRQGVITFENAFHGRTYMAMTLTSKVKPYKFGFGPFCPEVYRIPFAYCYRCPFGREYPSCELYCAEYLEDFFIGNVAAESVAAVIAEPIQGEGGFVVPPPGYFKKIKAICERHGILFIMDEIQTGMGRTGKLFASEHYDVVPDIILTAKSLAAGLPLAGITGRAEIMETPHVGGLGGTFGGNPIACRAALAVLDLLNTELLEKAAALGEKVRTRFLELQEKFDIIGDVRIISHTNLPPGLPFRSPREEDFITPDRQSLLGSHQRSSCFNEINYGNVIRTLMPLVITDEQLERGLAIMEDELSTL